MSILSRRARELGTENAFVVLGEVERLIAEGNVAVEQGERHASCQQATYERKLQTIVCRGKAEVVQGCDRVRGREIEFDLERERVRVTGAASVLIRPEDADGECKGKEMLE